MSRDDAGRFMSAYVQQGVFPEDPFHRLDADGVGELLEIAAERGRQAKPGLTLSICGEHGGNPGPAKCHSRDMQFDVKTLHLWTPEKRKDRDCAQSKRVAAPCNLERR